LFPVMVSLCFYGTLYAEPFDPSQRFTLPYDKLQYLYFGLDIRTAPFCCLMRTRGTSLILIKLDSAASGKALLVLRDPFSTAPRSTFVVGILIYFRPNKILRDSWYL